MPRTTAELVGGIIQVNSSIDLTPFIATATVLVDDVEADSTHDAERLELIERYLSAHVYTLRDPRIYTEQGGSVSVVYQSKVALNLASSHYGQMAMILDTSGVLSGLNAHATATSLKPKLGATVQAGVSWLGSELE